MDGYGVHEVFYQDCEIHGPCVWGSNLRAGPIYVHNDSYYIMKFTVHGTRNQAVYYKKNSGVVCEHIVNMYFF